MSASRDATTSPSATPVPPPAVQISIADPRVYLAAERTLLAWIRTGVALIGLGFLVAKFGLFLRELVMLRSGTHVPPQSSGAPSRLGASPLSDASPLLADESALPAWIGGAIVVAGAVLVVLAGIDHMRMLRSLHVDAFIARPRRYLSGALSVMVGITGILLALYLLLL